MVYRILPYLKGYPVLAQDTQQPGSNAFTTWFLLHVEDANFSFENRPTVAHKLFVRSKEMLLGILRLPYPCSLIAARLQTKVPHVPLTAPPYMGAYSNSRNPLASGPRKDTPISETTKSRSLTTEQEREHDLGARHPSVNYCLLKNHDSLLCPNKEEYVFIFWGGVLSKYVRRTIFSFFGGFLSK